MVSRFAACFDETATQALVEHRIDAMVTQRVFGIALRYEYLIDHYQLRHYPIFSALSIKLTTLAQELCAILSQKHSEQS